MPRSQLALLWNTAAAVPVLDVPESGGFMPPEEAVRTHRDHPAWKRIKLLRQVEQDTIAALEKLGAEFGWDGDAQVFSDGWTVQLNRVQFSADKLRELEPEVFDRLAVTKVRATSPRVYIGQISSDDNDEIDLMGLLGTLIDHKWLPASEARVAYASKSSSFVDFERAQTFKRKCLKKAWSKFRLTADKDKAYQEFCQKEAYWLDDYALFEAAKREYKGAEWINWPDSVKYRETKALNDNLQTK